MLFDRSQNVVVAGATHGEFDMSLPQVESELAYWQPVKDDYFPRSSTIRLPAS